MSHWREQVVFDQSCFGKIVVTGPDAAAAMEWLCSNTIYAPAAGNGDGGGGGDGGGDTKRSEVGSCTYTCMLSDANDGGVLADLVVSVMDSPHITSGGGGGARTRSSYHHHCYCYLFTFFTRAIDQYRDHSIYL